jgi:hypothetical protein
MASRARFSAIYQNLVPEKCDVKKDVEDNVKNNPQTLAAWRRFPRYATKKTLIGF